MDRRAFLKTSLAAAAGAVLPLGLMIPRAHALSLQSGSVFNQQVSLNGFITGSNIVVQYSGLHYNQPNTYGNVLALWENASQVPYGQPPISQMAIASNAPAGSQFMSAPQANQVPYVVGYATGNDLHTICATLSFYPGRADGVAFSTQIHPAYIGADSVAINFQTPTGNQPATNGNWVGLWQGETASFEVEPLAKAMVPVNANTGTVLLNNVPILRGATYTAAYFTGDKQTDMAATFTMTT
jgi:hypothetical protein